MQKPTQPSQRPIQFTLLGDRKLARITFRNRHAVHTIIVCSEPNKYHTLKHTRSHQLCIVLLLGSEKVIPVELA